MKLLFSLFPILFSCAIIAQTVTPGVNGSEYFLSFANLIFTVDASSGAKVSSLLVDGTEFMVDETQSPGYLYGSSLWPAPQTEMGWPPPMELDDGTYTASINENTMKFVSPVDVDNDGNNLQFIKSFWADEADTSISIKYSLVNKGSGQITKALWELTRVPVNGLSFWPSGPGGVWGNLADGTTVQNNHTWMDVASESRRNAKFFADGDLGWFAHVNDQNVMFIKTFDNVLQSNFAESEGEIEWYISDTYIELENLSDAVTLNANDTLHYNVKWYVRQLPGIVSAEAGNEDLVNYVNYYIYGTPFPASLSFNQTIITHNVFPNPTNQYIQFNLSDNKIVELILYDIMGKICIFTHIDNGEIIDLSELNSGVYLYTLKCNNRIEKGRIIKQ